MVKYIFAFVMVLFFSCMINQDMILKRKIFGYKLKAMNVNYYIMQLAFNYLDTYANNCRLFYSEAVDGVDIVLVIVDKMVEVTFFPSWMPDKFLFPDMLR